MVGVHMAWNGCIIGNPGEAGYSGPSQFIIIKIIFFYLRGYFGLG